MCSVRQFAIKALQLLTTPAASEGVPASSQSVLECALQKHMNELHEFLQSVPQFTKSVESLQADICALLPEDCTQWKYAVWILRLMNLLCLDLNKSVVELVDQSEVVKGVANLLSIDQKKTLSSAFQFVVVFGVCPYLEPGVGIPMRYRFESAVEILKGDISSKHLNKTDQFIRLSLCVNALWNYVDQPELCDILLSKHLGDLFAGLAQLAYGKLEFQQNTSDSDSCNTRNFDQRLYDSLTNRSGYVEKLESLLARTSPSQLIQEVLMLQAGSLMASQKGKPTSDSTRKPPPVWLRKMCKTFIWRIVCRSEGVLAVFLAVMQDDGNEDPRKCEAAARIVVDCYQTLCERETHFISLSPQVLYLLETLKSGRYLRAAVSVTTMMFAAEPILTVERILEPLLSVLYLFLDESYVAKCAHLEEIVDETALTKCIENVHKVFVVSCDPHVSIIGCLMPVVDVFFFMYKATRTSVTHLRNLIYEILRRYLLFLDLKKVVHCLRCLSFGNAADFKRVSEHVSVVTGDSGGLKAVKDQQIDDSEQDWDSATNNVVDLLLSLQSHEDIVAEFFLSCLEELTEMIATGFDFDAAVVSGSSLSTGDPSESLLDIEARIAKMEVNLRRNLTLLGIIGTLCERLENTCLKNTKHIIIFVKCPQPRLASLMEFLVNESRRLNPFSDSGLQFKQELIVAASWSKVTLERAVKVIDLSSHSLLSVFDNETLLMAMGLMSTLLTDENLSKKIDWTEADQLLPLLQRINDTHSDETIQQIAFDLRVAIATRGQVSSSPPADVATNINAPSLSSSNSSSEKERNQSAAAARAELKPTVNSHKSSSKPVIEVVDESFSSHEEKSAKPVSGKVTEKEGSTFREVMDLLKDPLIPVQGHALICLRRLVEKNDAETLESGELIYSLCLENISHSDSYIYLNAVQLLAALVAKSPQKFLSAVVSKYLCVDADTTAEYRMKLGEVLVKVSAGLGSFVPHYKGSLLNGCLRAARDVDPMIRASALSNLGQVCQNLHFSLGSDLYEVFGCVQALLKSDESVEVRRSAAMCITLLLRGLASDCLKVLGGDMMQNMYRLLKHVRDVETDERVQLHAQLAFEEIDRFMKQFLFPTQTLTKRIHVVDPFDVD